jgi:hypothetical protein
MRNAMANEEASNAADRLDETLRRGEDKIAQVGDAASRAMKDQLHH